MTKLKVTVSSEEEARHAVPFASAIGVSVDVNSRESILAAREIFASLPIFLYTVAEIEPRFAAQAMRVYELAAPHALEIRGSEKPEYLKKLRSKLGCHVIKSLEGGDAEKVAKYAEACDAIAIKLAKPEVELGLRLKGLTPKPVIFSFYEVNESVEDFLAEVKPFAISLSFKQLAGQRINSLLAKLSP
jgi:phosphoribosylanthranilate isomerase